MWYDILYSILIYPLIFIWPAYIANAAPVIFGRKAKTPVDFGRKLAGNRIFGAHKTWRGLIGGIASGFIMAYIESLFLPYMLIAGILMTLGTHFGDLLGSFIKRRLGKAEGVRFELMDQYFFLVFALIFAVPTGIAGFPNIYGMVFLFALTFIMHKATNKGANLLKLKEVPW